MAETTTEQPAAKTGAGGDERLAHRGPIQTLLTRPEIGALMGAVGVWLLFWLVSAPFGTVGGTANFLDVAAYLGLMAVPVALLMIGGEFDLSSGAMTGATAIIAILLANDINGAGLGLHIAVPLSLAFALAIGWFNGTLVEKTSLPSFIVTLGTFFMLIGAKLGFSKLFTNKVLVEGLDEAEGYDFWNGIFGAEWLRNSHIWDTRRWSNVWLVRDEMWALLLVAGVVALLLGTFELTYARRQSKSVAGVVAGVVGAVVALVGLITLLGRDGSGSNYVGGILVAAGVLVAVAGWCRARYESPDRGESGTSAGWWKYLVGGLAAVIVAMGVAAAMNAEDSSQLGFLGGPFGKFVFALGIAVVGILAIVAALGRITPGYPALGAVLVAVPTVSFLVTVQAARVILFGGLALLGIALLWSSARRVTPSVMVSGAVSVAIVVLAFFIQSESASRKLRVELFTVLLLVALFMAASALARHLSAARTAAPPPPQFGRWMHVSAALGVAGAVVFTVIELADGDAILYALISGTVKGGILAFAAYAVGTLGRTLFTRDEGVGRALITVGIGSVMLSVAARLLFVTGSELEEICNVGNDGELRCPQTQFGVVVLSFLIFAAIGSWLLMRTQFGSWIMAVGGNKEAARSVGVPAARTKTTLFMMVSGAAWITGMLIAFRLTAVQADVGDGNEFRYIIVAVVGGNLLTGGYGSALGAGIGAVIWGMISQGIGFAQWNSDWRFLVLGALLLVAVLVNNYVRGRAEKAPTASAATKPDRAEITIVVPTEPSSDAKEGQQ
jgi:ribose/xylose/arabinose/galactoside ABC-type transport system permease subunit